MIRSCLLVLAGGFAAQHSRVPLSSDLCTVLFVAVVVILPVRHARCFALLTLGLLLFMQAGNGIIDARLDPRFAGDSILAKVRITDFPKVTGASVSMLIEPVNDPRVPLRARITWFDPTDVPSMGDIWEFELRLRRPRGASNPGVFRLENWMFRERLQATGYVVAGKRNRLIRSESLSLIQAYRRSFVDRAHMADAASAAVLAAIGVGTRHEITRHQWDQYAKTGTSHLMAISGLHIGLAAAAAFVLVAIVSGGCRLRGNHLDHATIIAAGMATTYAAISGFAVPSQRATIVLVLAAVAFVHRRRPDAARMLAQVALLVFIIDPIASMTPGFSLSFGAVVALLWSARSYWRPVRGRRCCQLIAMQLVLLLGLMPLTVLIFQRVAVTAPIVNLIALPVFSVVTVPLTLASMLVNPVWEAAGSVLLRLSAASIHLIERVIGIFANLEIANISIAGVGGPDRVIWCFVLLPALWVALPRAWPGRWIAVLGVIAILAYKPAAPAQGCFDTHFLDVGQGLAVVVQSNRHTLVFDTGVSYRGGGSAAEQIMLPFLRYLGIDAIDWLVISHADDDHAGGVSSLVHDVEIIQTFAGEPLQFKELDVVDCVAGQVWRADGIEFQFLHPEPGMALGGNDSSCVLAVSAGRHRLILTGDIEFAAEQRVLTQLRFETVSVVLIPHHGSLTSSSPAFVNHLKPILAIASAGYANRWGFPKERVTRRWEGAGALVLDTASSGAISLRLCTRDGLSQLREERLRQQRFWHDSGQL